METRSQTIVLVAHRLMTVCNADRILVLANSKSNPTAFENSTEASCNIVEAGSHDELMELKGIYWKMIQAQDVVPMFGDMMTITSGNVAEPIVTNTTKVIATKDHKLMARQLDLLDHEVCVPAVSCCFRFNHYY